MKIIKIISVMLIIFVLLSCYMNAIPNVNQQKYKSRENKEQSTFSQKNSYEIYVDLSEYTLYLFKDNEIIKKYPVAGGERRTPSPFGSWKIVSKAKWGKGFGGYWMEINVPWGKYGIHGTTRPSSIGNSTSHGCIRMFNKDVAELWNIVPIGTPVIITMGAYSPFGRNPRTIIPGDRGTDVLYVQLALRKKGLYKGAIDGIYGDEMKFAIFELQRQNNIQPHNEIDKQTLEALGIFPFE